MDAIFDFNTVNGYISFFISLCTILYWGGKYLLSIINYSRIKNVKAGIYNGFWVDPIKKELHCEVSQLKKTLAGIKITPIYKHKSYFEYTILAKPYPLNKYIFGGTWVGEKNTNYKGYALFFYSLQENGFIGKWIGPKSTGEINSGDWIMNYFVNANNSYVNYMRYKAINKLKEQVFPKKTILENIIKRHETFNAKSCTIDDITLQLHNDSFIPTLGKISIPFIEYVNTVVKAHDNVLDLGTGTGFYPIFLAKNKTCHVTGIDIEERTITLARSNAIQNNVSEFINFKTCSNTELFSSVNKSEKYDVIIANLPFSRISKSYKSRQSVYYPSFAGSVELLEQLILGSQYHIKPNGRLIFCYGESGYMDLLEAIVRISSWNHLTQIKAIHHKDDTFYIFELELSEKVKQFYQKINTEELSLQKENL